MSGWSRRWFGGGPGNVARDRRRGEQAERAQWEARTQDPYGENPPQWDEAGFPVGPMPRGKFALDYQYEANRRAEQRRQVLWGDAQNSMRQGLNLFQSYRAGGSAAAASGMYGQKAGLYATQALNTSAPDLLIDWREQIRSRAEEKTDELNRNSQVISATAGIIGGASPLLAQGEQPGPQNSTPAGGTYNVTGDSSAAFQAAGAITPGTPGQTGPTSPTPTQGSGVLPGIIPERTIGGGSAGDVFDAGGSYGGGGGGGASGGGTTSPGGRRGSGQGRGGATDESGAGMGGAAVAGGGLGDYSNQALADRSLGGAPMATDMTVSLWADDPYREQSTAIMAQSARETLLDAIALG